MKRLKWWSMTWIQSIIEIASKKSPISKVSSKIASKSWSRLKCALLARFVRLHKGNNQLTATLINSSAKATPTTTNLMRISECLTSKGWRLSQIGNCPDMPVSINPSQQRRNNPKRWHHMATLMWRLKLLLCSSITPISIWSWNVSPAGLFWKARNSADLHPR